MTDNKLGSHFKKWRERRGLSLKEAAGTIVTPQFLGQFERGKTSISVDKFLLLLMSIGVEIRQFFDNYDGLQVSKFRDFAIKQDEDVLQTYKKFPYLYQLADYVISQYSTNSLIKIDFSPKVQEPPYEKIFQSSYPNLLELEFFGLWINSDASKKEDYLYKMESSLFNIVNKKSEDTYITLEQYYNCISLLNQLARYYSRIGNYSKALQLIEKIRKLSLRLDFAANTLITLSIVTDMMEVFTWLRMGELTKAHQGYQRIMNFLDSSIAYNFNINYTELMVSYKTNLKNDFKRLLKEYQDKNAK